MKCDCEKCVHYQHKETGAGILCLCSFSWEHKEKQRRNKEVECNFFLAKEVEPTGLKCSNDFIVGYRSIGESELFALLAENPIYGKRKWDNVEESGCTLPYGAVSFFLNDLKWRDPEHLIDIEVALPTDTQTVIVKVLKADDTVIRTITLDNVPLVANKKTQIYGNLVKGELTFNVSINNGFKTEVEEKPVQ